MTTQHPCAGRSAAMRAAFERIAINEPPEASPRTLRALLNAGLIRKIGEKPLGRDLLGPITVPVYQVPLPIHMQWCKWAAENVSDKDLNEATQTDVSS